MPENFHDMKSIKQKRAKNFIGSVKEVTTVKQPKPKEKPVEATPQPVQQAPAPAPVEAKQDAAPAKEEVKLEKGFVVGYTSEGLVKLQPFGGVGELELVGLIEYSKIKSGEVLGTIARTKTQSLPAIEKGVIAIAEGVKSLLVSQETKTDS